MYIHIAYVWVFSFAAFACRFLAVDSSLFRGARRLGLDPPQPAAPGEKDSAQRGGHRQSFMMI